MNCSGNFAVYLCVETPATFKALGLSTQPQAGSQQCSSLLFLLVLWETLGLMKAGGLLVVIQAAEKSYNTGLESSGCIPFSSKNTPLLLCIWMWRWPVNSPFILRGMSCMFVVDCGQ